MNKIVIGLALFFLLPLSVQAQQKEFRPYTHEGVYVEVDKLPTNLISGSLIVYQLDENGRRCDSCSIRLNLSHNLKIRVANALSNLTVEDLSQTTEQIANVYVYKEGVASVISFNDVNIE